MRKVGFIPVGREARIHFSATALRMSGAAALWLAVVPWAVAQGQTPPGAPGFQDQPPAATRPAANSAGFRSVAKPSSGAAKKAVAAKASASDAAETYSGKASDVAGRYALIRAAGRDSGCMLTLDDKARGPKGSFKAVLGPGCPDQGLLIFDPVGWLLEKGRLALIARAGHQTHLDPQPDGTWTKDPKEGAALELKKL